MCLERIYWHTDVKSILEIERFGEAAIDMKRPTGISFIGYFYIFGAIILILTLGIKQDIDINIRFGVPFLPEIAVRIFVALFSIIMAYGYLNLKKWGYWTMIIYSIVFSIISINQMYIYHSQLFIGNIIFSIIVLFYTFNKRHIFHSGVLDISM